MLLNAETMSSLSSTSFNHVLTIWSAHAGAETRGSFSFTVGAFQGALHSLWSLACWSTKKVAIHHLIIHPPSDQCSRSTCQRNGAVEHHQERGFRS